MPKLARSNEFVVNGAFYVSRRETWPSTARCFV